MADQNGSMQTEHFRKSRVLAGLAIGVGLGVSGTTAYFLRAAQVQKAPRDIGPMQDVRSALTAEEILKLESNLSVDSLRSDHLSGTIYNGSDYTLDSVTFRIRIMEGPSAPQMPPDQLESLRSAGVQIPDAPQTAAARTLPNILPDQAKALAPALNPGKTSGVSAKALADPNDPWGWNKGRPPAPSPAPDPGTAHGVQPHRSSKDYDVPLKELKPRTAQSFRFQIASPVPYGSEIQSRIVRAEGSISGDRIDRSGHR